MAQCKVTRQEGTCGREATGKIRLYTAGYEKAVTAWLDTCTECAQYLIENNEGLDHKWAPKDHGHRSQDS
jgi:hypothetical protein